MQPIRFRSRQLGLTLVELMIVVMLGIVVVLAAGAIYRGVDRSFKQGAQKIVGSQGATLLSSVLSRRARIASGFMIYDVRDRTVEADPGNGLALLDSDGNVTYRFEWDTGNMTLADSTGTRVNAMNLQTVLFSSDPVSPQTIRFGYQTVDENYGLVDIESAVALRN